MLNPDGKKKISPSIGLVQGKMYRKPQAIRWGKAWFLVRIQGLVNVLI